MKPADTRKLLRTLRRRVACLEKRLAASEREASVVRDALRNTNMTQRALRRAFKAHTPKFMLSTAVNGKVLKVTIPPGLPLEKQVALYEKAVIVSAIESTQGNRSAAAKLLKMRPNTFFYTLLRHGIARKI